MNIPVRLMVSVGGGFNFVLLDRDQGEDWDEGGALYADGHEALLDALWHEAQQRGEGTHVLTVRI